MDVNHKKSDIQLFTLRRKTYLEEDVFTYFYPFCMLNSVVLTGVILRKQSAATIVTACACMAEYVYFLFAFPVENWHYHKRAVSRDKPYAQHVRDSYITRFPNAWKTQVYRRVNSDIERDYAARGRRVLI